MGESARGFASPWTRREYKGNTSGGGGEEGAERTAIESISGQLRPKIYENWLNNQAGCYLN